MKRVFLFILCVCLLCFTVLAACDDGNKDKGTLTIADITVSVGEEKDINPVFSIEAGKGDVTYTFEGNNISIENGKVKGLVANTETLVTAKTDNHEVVFKVKVTEKTIDRGTLTIADITVNEGATVDVNPVFSTEAGKGEVTYTFDGNNISIADGKVTGLVGGTETVVTATTSYHEITFKVNVSVVDRGTLKINNIMMTADVTGKINPIFSKEEGKSALTYTMEPAGIIEISADNAITVINPGSITQNIEITVTATGKYLSTTFKVTVSEINRGTLTVSLPIGNTEDQLNTLYANYSARPLSATFSKPEFAEQVTYSVESAYQSKVTIEDGNKIKATGDFSTPANVKVTAVSENFTAEVTIKVTNFNGKNHVGNSLDLENKVKSRLSNWENLGEETGGVLFMGDSFFDTGFWSDFYTTYSRKNAITMGISATTTTDWEYMVERLVYPVAPKAVVIHCGTNNIFDDKKNANTVIEDVKKLFDMVHENLPDAQIYYFGIEPRVGRDNSAPKAANVGIKAYCDENDWLTYLDSPSWCYDNEGNVISGFFRDGIHPSLENYSRYVRALEDAGLVVDASEAATDPTIDDITTTPDQSIAKNNTYQLFYRGLPLTNNYVLTGKIDIAVAAKNPHIQFKFTGNNRFLIWDGESFQGNGSMGLGWQVNSTYVSDDDDIYAYNQNEQFTVLFKLVVTDSNAYFYFGNDNEGTVTYTLNSVFVNLPDSLTLIYGTENMSAKLYNLTAKTALDDPDEYAAATVGAEFDYYENAQSVTDGLYVNIPSGDGLYVVRDSQRTEGYIDYSSEFYLKGVSANNDTGYDGISRDWRVVSGGTDNFTGDFAVSYDFEIVKRGTLESIDALSAENVSAVNWFHVASISTDNVFNAWKDYHVLYWKTSDTTAKIDGMSGSSPGTMTTRTGLTDTKISVIIVRSGNTVYIAMKADGVWTIKTCDYTATSAYVFLSNENVNGKITNFTVSKVAADVTAALTEIGKNA